MKAEALVVFDIDGTLFQTELATVRAVQEVFAENGLPLPSAPSICSFFGKPVEDQHRWLESQCPPESAKSIVAAVDRREMELIGKAGRLYDGVTETLARLRDGGYTLAVCSNGPVDYVNEFLDAHGLRRFFDTVRCRGMGYAGKTEMLADILAEVAVRPAIVVGDRHDDVESAHAHGALAVGAAYGYGGAEELTQADAVVWNASEILGAIEMLLARERGREPV